MPLTITPPTALKIEPNTLLHPHTAVTEADIDRLPHLPGDLRLARRNRKAKYRESIQAKTAAEAMGAIPGEDDAIHMAISGRFALFDFVPAALELGGCKIDAVTIATLGFSRRNVLKLCELIDAGRIGNARMLYSHYFRGTSAELCECLDEQFAARPERARAATARTHAKILLVAFADGRRMTLESSANLRSCKNIEQATAIGGEALYGFHLGWIDGLFNGGMTSDGKAKDR